MKSKLMFLTAALLFSSGYLFAQSPLPKGKSQLNVGLGFSGWGVPFYVGIDHAVHKDVTIGGEFSYRGYNERWRDADYRRSITGFAMNGNYHFNSLLDISPDWDLYAGLNIGFFVWNSPREYRGPNTSGLGLGAQVGGRYYFSNKAGINLEFGGGNAFSGGKFGFTFKL